MEEYWIDNKYEKFYYLEYTDKTDGTHVKYDSINSDGTGYGTINYVFGYCKWERIDQIS